MQIQTPTIFFKLESLANDFNFKIHVEEPTDENGSILDQFITNCDKYIINLEVSDPVSVNDHYMIGLWLDFKVPKGEIYKRIMWNFNNLDEFLNAVDNYNFDFCENIEDLNYVVEHRTDRIYNLALNCIPNKLVIVRSNDKLWYNGHLRKLLRKKMYS